MIWALHGALGSADDWRLISEPGRSLAPSVQAVDLWQDYPSLDFTSWSVDFCQTVRKRDPEPVLLGYSMGGRLALHALLAGPDLWQAAVIVSAHTGLPPAERLARERHDAEWARRFQSEPFARFLETWKNQAVFADGDADSSGRPPVARHPNMIRSFTCWSLARQEDLADQLSSIPCSVLWITGQKDAKFTEIGRRACQQIPLGRHVTVENVGHRVPWQWPAFSRFVDSWIAGPQGTRRPD